MELTSNGTNGLAEDAPGTLWWSGLSVVLTVFSTQLHVCGPHFAHSINTPTLQDR